MPTPALRLVHSDTWMPEGAANIADPTKLLIDEDVMPKAEGHMEIDDLYPARAALSSPMQVAIGLLKDVVDLAGSALECLVENDRIGADDRIQLIHARLFDLFCQRQIGDGFGGVVNACICALENSHGEPVSSKQVQALNHVLTSLRRTPLLDFERAAELIEILADAGFSVEPENMDALADLLSA